MMSSTHSLPDRSVRAVLVALVLALAPPSVHAASLNGGASPSPETQARARFSEGNIAYDLAEFQKALDAYTEAYRLVPLPGFLFNIAQCHRQLGHAERAAFFYRRYLSLSKEEPSNAPLVHELIAEMDAAARKEPARSGGLRAQGEAAASRQAREQERKRALSPRSTPVETQATVKDGDSLAKKWWVWAGAGAVALVAGGTIYAVATAPQPRPTTLGNIR